MSALRIDQLPDVRIDETVDLEWIPASQLQSEPLYQRKPNDKQIQKIADEFDPDTFGYITVSRRPNGDLYVIDGQHRVAAIRKMGWHTQNLPCVVKNCETVEQEARIFWLIQTTRRAMRPIDVFKARLFEGEPKARNIDLLVKNHGYRLLTETSGSRNPNELDCVGAVERTYNFGSNHLSDTLKVTKDAWGTNEYKITSYTLLGVSYFMRRYQALYDRKRLVSILASAIPSRIDANAKEMQVILGGVREEGTARTILRMYNKGMQSNRLPEWDAVQSARAVLTPSRKDLS